MSKLKNGEKYDKNGRKKLFSGILQGDPRDSDKSERVGLYNSHMLNTMKKV